MWFSSVAFEHLILKSALTMSMHNIREHTANPNAPSMRAVAWGCGRWGQRGTLLGLRSETASSLQLDPPNSRGRSHLPDDHDIRALSLPPFSRTLLKSCDPWTFNNGLMCNRMLNLSGILGLYIIYILGSFLRSFDFKKKLTPGLF